MQIKIEIDVKPEELRRFLGLPDVAGLQEEFIAFLRQRLGNAGDGFDPASFVKDNLSQIRSNPAWQRLLYGTGEGTAPSKPRPRRRKAARSD